MTAGKHTYKQNNKLTSTTTDCKNDKYQMVKQEHITRQRGFTEILCKVVSTDYDDSEAKQNRVLVPTKFTTKATAAGHHRDNKCLSATTTKLKTLELKILCGTVSMTCKYYTNVTTT